VDHRCSGGYGTRVGRVEVDDAESDLAVPRGRASGLQSGKECEVQERILGPGERGVVAAVPRIGCGLVVVRVKVDREGVAVEGERASERGR
jgi:hypothetical protein